MASLCETTTKVKVTFLVNKNSNHCALHEGAQIFKKSRNHVKILGAQRVTLSKFHAEDPQLLGTTVQNLVAMTN
jgi:hypothetical protein